MGKRRRSGGRRRGRGARFWVVALTLLVGAGLVALSVVTWRWAVPSAGPAPTHLRVPAATPGPPEKIGAAERAQLEGILEHLEATPGARRSSAEP